MKTLLMSLFLLSSVTANAMPCDVSASRYGCKSASGRYEFSLLTCGFDDSVKNWNLKVAGAEIEGADLHQSWIGTAFLGFQILAEDGKTGAEKEVIIEISQKNMLGKVVERARAGNPAPWNTLKTEAIKCEVKNARD